MDLEKGFGLDNGSSDGVRLDEEDTNKWEIDTKPIIEDLYHELLGEKESVDGVWEVDPTKTRRMNQLGASVLVNEIKSRVNKIMALSDLEEGDIKSICRQRGVVISEMLFDFWEVWEVDPKESNMESISDMIVENLFIALRTARNSGMRKHRERSKFPSLQNPFSQNVGGVM